MSGAHDAPWRSKPLTCSTPAPNTVGLTVARVIWARGPRADNRAGRQRLSQVPMKKVQRDPRVSTPCPPHRRDMAFHAGTAAKRTATLVAAGGRVLATSRLAVQTLWHDARRPRLCHHRTDRLARGLLCAPTSDTALYNFVYVPEISPPGALTTARVTISAIGSDPSKSSDPTNAQKPTRIFGPAFSILLTDRT